MNSLRLVFLLLGVVYGQLTNAQCRLLYHSQDLIITPDQDVVPDTTDQITSIESRGALSKYLIVHYAHSRRKLIAKTSIWGYVDSRNAVWRSYEKELFLVIKNNGGWIEYAVNRPVRTRLTAMHGAIMYSRTLDSDIKSNWADAMADVPKGYIVH
ncbi:hypothetical protein BH09BAC4_BH09BAC4_26270 [soil metagenome]